MGELYYSIQNKFIAMTNIKLFSRQQTSFVVDILFPLMSIRYFFSNLDKRYVFQVKLYTPAE